MSNTIDSSYYLPQKTTQRTGSSELGKDEFLKILMTQLQNQDPMNPMEDKEFISQMASFSSLEQMSNMSKSFEKFISFMEQNQVSNYSGLIGKAVNWQEEVEVRTDDGETETKVNQGVGVIQSLKMTEDGVAQFVLEDGKTIVGKNITQLQNFEPTNNVVESSNLIGKLVSWMKEVFNEETNENEFVETRSVVDSVSFKGGGTTFNLEDGTSISKEQIISISKASTN